MAASVCAQKSNRFVGGQFVSLGDREVINTMRERNVTERPITREQFEQLTRKFRASMSRLKQKNKKLDAVFLIDSSSSVGRRNFMSEVKFVKKLLSDFPVSINYTRVAVVQFSSHGRIHRHIDQISIPKRGNDKCMLINHEILRLRFIGGGTFTYGALREARDILSKARKHSQRVIFLITDGFSNGKDPIPLANRLKRDNVTIFSVGIANGNVEELNKISTEPAEDHTFLLNNFTQFESLARKALHVDFRMGQQIPTNSTFCGKLCDRSENGTCCDENAVCSCGIGSGHYSCLCKPGYFGSGLKNNCHACSNSTYWHTWNFCKPCPDINHITMGAAIGIEGCVCKDGFLPVEGNRCEVITCPKLTPPKNGYFVKHPQGCGNVLNAACGARCKSGYQLVGSSIRLCQQNGTWSGSEPECVLKACPALQVPYYGQAVCKNSDLNLIADYTPRNTTFMEYYMEDEHRITEPMPIDTNCIFKCGPGYYLVGSSSRNCLPLSKWDGLQTTCRQIFCSKLPKITFGSYDPTDCDENKSTHGTNCTIICDEGFDIKGPVQKTCTGKRNGFWTHKSKHPKCVDVTPPKLTCPENMTLSIESTESYAIVTSVPKPSVSDNSGMNVTFWTKPVLEANVTQLTLGSHIFSYIATDSFRNRAICNFTITVEDRTPPVLDNCFDPPEFYVRTFGPKKMMVEWEDPIIYDNSNTNLNISQSLEPGYLKPGRYEVKYTATDSFNNSASCTMNITVKELQCEKPAFPENGKMICASNDTQMWCHVICNSGFAAYDAYDESHMENLTLFCDHDHPRWKYDPMIDCTKIDLPESVDEVLTISLDSDMDFCESEHKDDFYREMREYAHQEFCGNQTNCEVITDLPLCTTDEVPSDPNLDKNVYHIMKKRELGNGARKNRRRHRMHLRVSVVNQARRGGQNKDSHSRKLKTGAEFFSKSIQGKYTDVKLNVGELSMNEIYKCPNGSVLKKQFCVQCPRGTYHNKTGNSCQVCPKGAYSDAPGRQECQICPLHHSTRRENNKSDKSCLQQCPPGTMARLKVPKRVGVAHALQKTFMPYCKKCLPGEYQALYDQIRCEPCPDGFISPRGAKSFTDCSPRRLFPCQLPDPVCGQNGACIPDAKNPYLYSCICNIGFQGSHCEQHVDLCLSSPCLNGGICHHVSTTEIGCQCPEAFTGLFCEEIVTPCLNISCQNGGVCFEIGDKGTCECPEGFSGDLCEIEVNHCADNPCEAGECQSIPDVGYQCTCPPGIIGRRCHLRPCDYFPCNSHQICIDLPEVPTTKLSFLCRCPVGLKGINCTEVDNPCDKDACKNNGMCFPKALRNGLNDERNESLFEEFTCQCPPYFYGDLCQALVTPDYVLQFSKPHTTNYAMLPGPSRDLEQFTLCTWIKSEDDHNYGTIISYATAGQDNMLTLTDYNGLALYVNGSFSVSDIVVNDGHWHFICATWMSKEGSYQMYSDGILQHSGYNLSSSNAVENGGVLVLGQEQDTIGSGFSDSETFIGEIAYLDMWDRVLGIQEVQEFYSSCHPYHGNLYSWSDFKTHLKGDVTVQESPFCKPCPKNLNLINGIVNYFANRAIYTCNEGFTLEGLPIRNCLRTAEWQQPEPLCKILDCGPLESIANGHVSLARTTFGANATYVCSRSYELQNGTQSRFCESTGKWSGTPPQCIERKACPAVEPPNWGRAVYSTLARDKHPPGTFIEFECANETVLQGQSLIVCEESGQWDFEVPQCVPRVESFEMEIVTRRTEDEEDALPLLSREDFWGVLRTFLYQGCANQQETNQLCKLHQGVVLSDLGEMHLEQSQGDELRLFGAIEAILAENERQDLTIGNLMENIFKHGSISRDEEDLFRMQLCFFMDLVIWNTQYYFGNDTPSIHDESLDVSEKLPLALVQLLEPIYENYRKSILETTESRTNTTSCPEQFLPQIEHSRIVGIHSSSGESVSNLFNFATGTRIAFECENGFHMSGEFVAECRADGKWATKEGVCLRKCEIPSIPANMNLENSTQHIFIVGQRVKLNCLGRRATGDPFIECLSTGMWSNVQLQCALDGN
ncbi:sushi, von Willebrand factor type A, EGF and pentraxin domain-containing protein 1-like [Phlebotomus argentipes]|uniref:sushi, von Willebrand factor type A, EGF and pentraxin domain-containing protein 1-like n=1 Tax=Phlebotomus argentipes TaxID=94469 RepID=UPI002892A66D|nr:sushi, von Willebrand factor type A, EGF and pentraxin domain-containing protein 1-like [Phlebotomus argentipes]